MNRVLIIGCGGSGKSTLARALGEITGLPVVHLDKLFWKPGWVESSREEIDGVIRREIGKGRWIIDGNYNRTLPQRLERCDSVIYLDFSRLACLLGVAKRILTTRGTVRPDMGEGCPERFDLDFLKWVWNFNKNKRQRYYEMLNALENKQVYILKSRREVKAFLSKVADDPM